MVSIFTVILFKSSFIVYSLPSQDFVSPDFNILVVSL